MFARIGVLVLLVVLLVGCETPWEEMRREQQSWVEKGIAEGRALAFQEADELLNKRIKAIADSILIVRKMQGGTVFTNRVGGLSLRVSPDADTVWVYNDRHVRAFTVEYDSWGHEKVYFEGNVKVMSYDPDTELWFRQDEWKRFGDKAE